MFSASSEACDRNAPTNANQLRLHHKAGASPDSISVASKIEFPTGTGIGIGVFYLEPEPRPGWQNEVLAKMEWAILTSLAGPFAESASRNARSRAEMRRTARLFCGSKDDYGSAKAILLDYTKASKLRRRIPHFEDCTRDLILKSWPAIDALAKTLLVKETLNYDGAYAVVEPFLEAPRESFTFVPY